MRRQTLGSLAVAFGLVAAPGPSAAVAATPIGELFPASNLCGPMVPGPPSPTFLQTTSPANRYAAPSAGVITSWSHQAGPGPPELRLKVARPTGGNMYTIVGESPFETPDPGVVNTFANVRIPVQAGDVIGFAVRVSGSCGRSGGDAPGYGTSNNGSDVPVGTNAEFTPVPLFQLSVSAALEPDCDSDGFGDETQDPDTSICKDRNFSFGKLKRNRKKGTATLTVNVPNPGELTGSGNGAKVASAGRALLSKSVGAGTAKLLIQARGRKKEKLNTKGRVKLKVAVTYTPTGGRPNTRSVKVKLKKTL
jgi:hypothetical protein